MLNIKELVEATNGNLLNGDIKFIPKEYVIDSRNIENNPFFVPIVGENTDGHKYILNAVEDGICGYFINKGFEKKEEVINKSREINKNIIIIEVDDTKEALYNAGVYNRNKHIDIPVVAVTGSVGKTSTREMISSVLSASKNVLTTTKNYNSIIGAPIMALKMDSQDVCVFEIGTDHKGEIERLSNLVKPDIGVITMIGTAHIGIFGSKDEIFKEKSSIVSHMKEGSTLVVNGDDEYLKTLKSNDKYHVVTFSENEIVDLEEKNDIFFKTNIYDSLEDITINQIGSHNAKNAVCAIKVAEILGIEKQSIIKGIENYKNFSRRLEKINLKNNVLLIDDTYNASIDSVKSGLKTVNKIENRRKIAVLGDMLELGNMSKQLHEEVGETFKELDFKALYLTGKESKYILETASKHVLTKYFENIDELISNLKLNIKENDVIYLKASNGMRFDKIVKALKELY